MIHTRARSHPYPSATIDDEQGGYVIPGKRTTVVALGLLAALTLPACAGYNPDGNGEGNQQVESPAPAAAAGAEKAPEQQAAPAGIATERLIGKSVPRMGKVVTDAKNWILYRFNKDSANPPTTNCSGDCAAVWPPVLVDGSPQLSGIEGDVGTVTRADGGTQVTLGGWPLYRYVGDPKPGAWKGQGVGGVWFVVAPDGKPNKSCLPAGTPTPVAPPASAGTSDY
jgi:predicted lipoprotein with Yx(FWY)xxD motif